MKLRDDVSRMLDALQPGQLAILERAHADGATLVLYINLSELGMAVIPASSSGEYIHDWIEKQETVNLELRTEENEKLRTANPTREALRTLTAEGLVCRSLNPDGTPYLRETPVGWQQVWKLRKDATPAEEAAGQAEDDAVWADRERLTNRRTMAVRAVTHNSFRQDGPQKENNHVAVKTTPTPQFPDRTVFIDEDAKLNGELEWHEIHDCECPVCLGQAEHCVASSGYEDIECQQGCGLVWLRGDPTDPNYFIDKRPDKSKKPCHLCNGLTIH